jgi:hypothetical protein
VNILTDRKYMVDYDSGNSREIMGVHLKRMDFTHIKSWTLLPELYWYDVCNDYTLELRADEPLDLGLYRTAKVRIDTIEATVHIQREHNEIHYLSSTSNRLDAIVL